jgi:hypothetical protein
MIEASSYDFAFLSDDHSTNRHLSGSQREASLTERFLHELLIHDCMLN